MNNRRMQEDFFNNIYLSLYCKGSKRLFKVRVREGAGDRKETSPHCYDHQRCVFLVLLMLGSTLLCAGFLYCILASSLDPNSSGPQGPFGLMWLSLPHLVYNSVRSLTLLQLNWPLTSVLTALYNNSTPTLSPIRSLKLFLWPFLLYVCNRHQAEITVMQFTCHSLPVHRSEVGPSHCPIL